MKRVPVESSALASVGYDARTRVLEIEFTSGSVYRYSPVPAEVHDALMAAESHGGYFTENVRNEGYDCVRVR
jgi:hypothetical protein